MNATAARFLIWTPRVITILFAAFLSLFALDVFREQRGFWSTAGALAMHLVPTYLVVLALIIAWRREWLGAAIFFGLAIVYVAKFWGRFPLSTYFAIAGPAIVLALLFLASWRYARWD